MIASTCRGPLATPPPLVAGGDVLTARECYRDWYLEHRDPIARDRMLWRAQAFRHLVHLLPGQSILELGAGKGLFTRCLAEVSQGKNPITAVSFDVEAQHPPGLPDAVRYVPASSPRALPANSRFDFVVAVDILDKSNCTSLLRDTLELLEPGGQVVFFQSNPWNPVLKLRRALSRLTGQHDPRSLLSRPRLYELMSEIGFIRVFSVYTDFVYAPLTERLVWLLRNLSILLENAPGIQTLAGSILLHAQKPPRLSKPSAANLATHKALEGAVSVVVPCHNEEMNVRPLVERLLALYGPYIHEIVLVDDNSQDGTREVMEALAAREPRVKPVFRVPPNGVGRALADGYQAASGRYLLSMDCDFQHLLPELRDLFDAAMQGFDVVVGSRFSRHSVLLNYPFQKIIANRGFHLLAQLVLRRRFRDLTNNLKLMRREVVEKLELSEPGFAANAETGLKPLLMGFSVKEVPISWINRTPDMGTSSFRLVQVGGSYWHLLYRLWREGRASGRGRDRN
jgi:dolichol-phosphate mannosyltransferase